MKRSAQLLTLVTFAAFLLAEDPPRTKPADYPAHDTFKGIEMGAEYLVRSIPTEKGVYFAKDYLVVEVAVFAPKYAPVLISANQFQLRLNGKIVLAPQSPGFVAAALKYSDWAERPNASATAGAGPATINLGGPQQSSRFPGDRRGTQQWPTPPVSTDPAGGTVEQAPPPSVDALIEKAALYEGQATGLVKGCLFFPYTKKTAGFKSIELLVEGAPLKLL